jgi:hypothetical protein
MGSANGHNRYNKAVTGPQAKEAVNRRVKRKWVRWVLVSNHHG